MNRNGLVGDRPGAWILGLTALAMGTVLLTPALRADDAAQRAARLSYVDGQVRIAQDNEVLADPALVNAPLFEGMQVLTSDEGRAEIQFDDGSVVVWLSPNGSLTLTVLRGAEGSGEAEVNLAGGLGYFEWQGGSGGSKIRVRFGDSVVTTDGFTVLRINLDNPPGELAVFSGNAHLERGNAVSLDLHGGESVTLGASDPSQYTLAESIEPDSWDTWNSDRDQALSTLAAARTGAEKNLPGSNNPAWNDLDANGNWYNVPGQGTVWSPFEASSPGWDPYGNGYWMFTPRFGYIWVSGDPWGYMPFQCGAWNFYNDFGWGWAPGGCRPWWGGGGGWISNIGLAPGHYRPPNRPHPGPPHNPIGRPVRGGLLPPTNAVVPINHRPPGGTAGLPTRDRNTIVTIGGHLVEPLRPVSGRPTFDRPMAGQSNRPQPGSMGATIPAGQRPATGFTPANNHPVYSPPPARTPNNNNNHQVYSPASRAPEPSHNTPPPSRAPSGGGGGGAPPSHSSGGGGGGGGGGSHGGGGGGGNSGGSGHH